MSEKTSAEHPKRNSASGVKILNDQKVTPTLPAKVQSSTPTKANKQISTLTIVNQKTSTTKKRHEHYVMQTIKSESSKNGDAKIHLTEDEDTIDFVLAENEDETKRDQPTSVNVTDLTEFHLIGEDDEAENTQVKEAVEHVCGKCYKTFRRVKSLTKHLEFCRFDSGYHLRKAEMLKNLEKIEKDAIVMEKKDICFCCSESYDTFHLGHINCPDCPKSFKTQMSYERHIFITHSEFNDYPCSICNAKLRSAALLKLHEEQHRNRGKPYACKICGKDFTRSYHLKRHQKYSSCSTNENDTMSCKVCDKVFYRLDNLRAHLKQHLGTQVAKKPEYMCHVCKNCFYSLSTLNIHIRTHTGEKPFDCDLCEKKFSALVALKKHRRYHTGEKPYTCSVCSQSFAVKEVLNRHMKRHTGERPHKCEECGKSFIQATQLRTHSKTHLRPYRCELCDEKFKTEKQLDRHIKEHTRTKRPKKFECIVCKILFRSESDYKSHMDKNEHEVKTKQGTIKREKSKIHERRDCAICDKLFDTTENLHAHILKVHECDPNDIFGEVEPANTADNSSSRKRTKMSPTKTTSKKVKAMSATAVAPEVAGTSSSTLISSNTDNNGVVVREFLIDEVPTDGSSAQQTIILENESYTVIPLEDFNTVENKPEVAETKTEFPPTVKKEQRKSLAASLAAAIADNDDEEISDEETTPEILNEEDLILKRNVRKLLEMLMDNATLKKFGWPDASEEIVLCKVIENCGHDLSKDGENYNLLDYSTRMREYLKLLLTLVIANDSVEMLLNNYPVDEVIDYVLGNDESDEENQETKQQTVAETE